MPLSLRMMITLLCLVAAVFFFTLGLRPFALMPVAVAIIFEGLFWLGLAGRGWFKGQARPSAEPSQPSRSTSRPNPSE